MNKGFSLLAAVGVFASLLGACSGEESKGSGAQLSGADGGGTGGSSGTSGDSGACVWDGTSQRKTLDCIGDDYEYLGSACRFTWHTCGLGQPTMVLSDVRFVIDCRVQDGSVTCDCLDRGKLVKTIPAPSDICWEQDAGVNKSPPLDEVYQPFLHLSESCSFCTYEPT